MSTPTPTSGARGWGYRLLGSGFDYLLHLRPMEWPVMATHTALGSILALSVMPAGQPIPWERCAIGLVLWVVFLNGGTLAINSAFDRDEGDIAYLRRPPPPPPHLFLWGLGLMVLGLVMGLALLSPAFSAVYALCLILSLLYSVPPWRLKAVAGADWAINMLGFGTLTPLAGWLATGREVTAWGWLLMAGFGPLFAALYPLTQLYQAGEDRARGDRTLALMLGTRPSLWIAVLATLAGFVLFGAAGVASGWHRTSWQWLALGVALVAWLLVLVPWLRTADSRSAAEHQRGMYLALAAWAVTDAAIASSWLL